MKKPYSSSIFNVLGVCMILWSQNCKNSCADAFIGMNWGRTSSQKLIPSMVVDLLLQNGIQDVRIFRQSDNVLEAFYDSGIRATLGIGNIGLENYSSNETAARDWMKEKILPYKDVMKFGYVTVGNNPFSQSFYYQVYSNAVDAFKNMQKALNECEDPRGIKATIPQYTDIINMTRSFKPSEADFRLDIKDKMVEYVKLLKENDAPFFLSMFPIHFVNNNSLDLEFAFMENNSSYFVKDINVTYTNVFELIYDSLHWALAKANAGSVRIIVAAIGWPTDSYLGASVSNAERFYRDFLPYIASEKGSPMRPKQRIDVFLNTLSDENQIHLGLGAYQRHWGIYENNGEPKYKIDFTGRRGGDDLGYPSIAKGVTRMPDRWCVFTGNYEDPLKVERVMQMACNESDCSSLEEGGSCHNVTRAQQISYAFNRYFQMMGQASQPTNDKCYLEGLGEVVTANPSNGSCIFPIEILSAEYADQGATFGVRGAMLGIEGAAGDSSSVDRRQLMSASPAGLLAFMFTHTLWNILLY